MYEVVRAKIFWIQQVMTEEQRSWQKLHGMGSVLDRSIVAQLFKKFASFRKVPTFVAIVPRSASGPNLEILNPSLHFFKIHYHVILQICV
jgi:hypothetical protein